MKLVFASQPIARGYTVSTVELHDRERRCFNSVGIKIGDVVIELSHRGVLSISISDSRP